MVGGFSCLEGDAGLTVLGEAERVKCVGCLAI